MKLQCFSLILLPFLSLVSASGNEQIVMNPTDGPFIPQAHAQPTLSDLLTVEQSASIFYSYARELELSRIFGDDSAKSTVLVPINKAVMALSRKPHEGQGSTAIGDDVEISEEEFDKLSKANVERWVSAHIIPETPIVLDSREYPTLLEGKSISFQPILKNDGKGPEWTRVTVEGGIRIIGMKKASNGVLYLLDGVISTE
ncbi:hypothetical protein P691DRAFT_779957 [Macrolepiota fuliginosa MF-IS2]|uniref:FAS1 domain-containing protein n=1 Tax=Macrolepiota fuliginosa MF-IS2 TaxID=1400762 RepID=A0A9P6BWP6_9AGAR|nr:hypothetical protein P691DRAFT_779957 [Macrolepiota fuliginosa MF-IS2]